MIIFTVFIAFILVWFFIEITLFIFKKINKDTFEDKQISYKNFILILRFIAITLFIFIVIYMYNFDNKIFIKTIEYCLGVIK